MAGLFSDHGVRDSVNAVAKEKQYEALIRSKAFELERKKVMGDKAIEASKKSEEKWVEHNQEVAEPHIRSSCSSWYMGSNIEGKPEIFLPYVGGFPEYVKKCQTISLSGYEGFLLYK